MEPLPRSLGVALAGQGVSPLRPRQLRRCLLQQGLRRPLAQPPGRDQGELPGDVGGQVSTGILAFEAVIKEAQELGQFGLQSPQLFDFHGAPSVKWLSEGSFVDRVAQFKGDFAL